MHSAEQAQKPPSLFSFKVLHSNHCLIPDPCNWKYGGCRFSQRCGNLRMRTYTLECRRTQRRAVHFAPHAETCLQLSLQRPLPAAKVSWTTPHFWIWRVILVSSLETMPRLSCTRQESSQLGRTGGLTLGT